MDLQIVHPYFPFWTIVPAWYQTGNPNFHSNVRFLDCCQPAWCICKHRSENKLLYVFCSFSFGHFGYRLQATRFKSIAGEHTQLLRGYGKQRRWTWSKLCTNDRHIKNTKTYSNPKTTQDRHIYIYIYIYINIYIYIWGLLTNLISCGFQICPSRLTSGSPSGTFWTPSGTQSFQIFAICLSFSLGK
jgi:hypothetical protein